MQANTHTLPVWARDRMASILEDGRPSRATPQAGSLVNTVARIQAEIEISNFSYQRGRRAFLGD